MPRRISRRGSRSALPPEREKLWQEAIANPDFKMYPHVYNVLALKGHISRPISTSSSIPTTRKRRSAEARPSSQDHHPDLYRLGLVRLHVQDASQRRAELVPQHQGARRSCCSPVPLISIGRSRRSTMRCCAGTTTGSRASIPASWTIRRCGSGSWARTNGAAAATGRCRRRAGPSSICEPGSGCTPSRSCRQAPTTTSRPMHSRRCRRPRPTESQKLRYLSEPLPHDMPIAGPSVLNLYAAIDQDDTNWIVILKDVGPDVRCADRARRRARHRRRTCTSASSRAAGSRRRIGRSIQERSTARAPWHPLTRAAQQPVVPGEINEYAIEIMATANLFKQRPPHLRRDHQPRPRRPASAAPPMSEYIPYHICSSRTVLHRILHDPGHPSHLLLPVIPNA